MGLKVIGAGLSRTGTLSLKQALEKIGFDECYHMIDFSLNPTHIDMVYRGYHGEKIDWDSVFTHKYQAAVDFPSFLFYKEMMEAYPDAKVILTVREPESWYESVRETVHRVVQNEEIATQIFGDAATKIREMIIGSMTTDKFEDKEHTIRLFNKHVEEVKRVVPFDKLLVYSVKEGWEPLCQFLGVNAPNTPFPKVNTREVVALKMKAMQEAGISNVSKELMNS